MVRIRPGEPLSILYDPKTWVTTSCRTGCRWSAGLPFQVNISLIIVHEACEPNAIVDLPDSAILPGEHGGGSISERAKAAGLEAATLFAYPYGDCNTAVHQVVRAAGYEAAFTITPGLATRDTDPFCVPRTEVQPEDRGRRLLRKVRASGRFPLLWLSSADRRTFLVRQLKATARAVLGRGSR
jgi:hypothetical protein